MGGRELVLRPGYLIRQMRDTNHNGRKTPDVGAIGAFRIVPLRTLNQLLNRLGSGIY